MVKMKESIRMWLHIFHLIFFSHHIWEGKENIILSGGGGAGEAASTVNTRLGLGAGSGKQGRSKRLKHHTVQQTVKVKTQNISNIESTKN